MFRTDAVRFNLFCEKLHSDMDAGKMSYEASSLECCCYSLTVVLCCAVKAAVLVVSPSAPVSVSVTLPRASLLRTCKQLPGPLPAAPQAMKPPVVKHVTKTRHGHVACKADDLRFVPERLVLHHLANRIPGLMKLEHVCAQLTLLVPVFCCPCLILQMHCFTTCVACIAAPAR